MESSMEVPQNLKIDLTCDPAIPHLGIYPKECKSVYYRDIFIAMFIATIATITKLWS
jgi:hypothetical protein